LPQRGQHVIDGKRLMHRGFLKRFEEKCVAVSGSETRRASTSSEPSLPEASGLPFARRLGRINLPAKKDRRWEM
jgi:hypothetical protein